MTPLMHCPFCGEIEGICRFNAQRATDSKLLSRYVIVCDTCGAQGPTEESTQRNTAILTAADSWNRRISHDEDLTLRVAFKLE
jgi:transcription elongation factor Elf1